MYGLVKILYYVCMGWSKYYITYVLVGHVLVDTLIFYSYSKFSNLHMSVRKVGPEVSSANIVRKCWSECFVRKCRSAKVVRKCRPQKFVRKCRNAP
jgi:hypothetical protein